MRLRSLAAPGRSAAVGFVGSTAIETPETLCDAYVGTGESFTQRPGPTGGTYFRPRVESKPSPCDHETIARPTRFPSSSERVRFAELIPVVSRAAASESAR